MTNFDQHWAADFDNLDRQIIKRPSLAERSEEIPSLVGQILERANGEEGWQVSGISPEVLALFLRYTWNGSGGSAKSDPEKESQSQGWAGSGIEFQNVLYRAGEVCQGPIIQMEDLPSYLHSRGTASLS